MNEGSEREGWGLSIKYNPSAGSTSLSPDSPGVRLPKRFSVYLTGPAWQYDIRVEASVVEGVAECMELCFTRRVGGPRIRNDDIRLKVDTIVRAATRDLMLASVHAGPEGTVRLTPISRKRAAVLRPAKRSRGTRVSEADVREVLDVWLKELARNPQAPTARASKLLFVSDSTIRRRLDDAERLGWLDPALRARAQNAKKER